MPDSLTDLWSNARYQKLNLSCMVLLGAVGLRRCFGHLIVARIPDDGPHVYTLRKITQYLVIAVMAAVLLIIWVRQLGDLSVAYGILAAGLAFALQEVIASIAGLGRAIRILSDSVEHNPRYQELLPWAQEQRRQARRRFAIKITPLEPRAYVRLDGQIGSRWG